ncbi:MAG: isoamylase early set domain-containing protein [Acidimicrobiales bacterium]
MKVTFTLAQDGLDGQAVAVVGDFNDWDPAAAPMTRKGGARLAAVSVAAGARYAFRYLCEDGQWLNDEAADAYEPNEFGVDNSILDLTGTA